MNNLIVVEDLTFELRRSEKRTTVGILIGRTGELVVSAPLDTPQELIERFVRAKYGWIEVRLARKEMLFRKPATIEYIDGEVFWYLGHSYRLRLIHVSPDDNSTPVLSLEGDRFLLRRDETERGEEHFIKWYAEQGRIWLEQRVQNFVHRIDAEPSGIRVQPLGYRWGSCGRSDVLYFHWRTMFLPPPIIDYVVVHELIHLHERRHNRAFWERMESAMPDYEARKRWLAENGSRF